MNCPACNAAMKEREVAGITIDECTGCNGYWFDTDELAQYRSKLKGPRRWAEADFDPREDQKPKACPRCRVLTLRYGDVGEARIFRCDNCRGIFMGRNAVIALGTSFKVTGSGSSGFDVDAEDIFDIGDVTIELIAWLFD